MRALAATAVALALAAGGCGGDDGASPPSEGAAPTTPPPATTTTGAVPPATTTTTKTTAPTATTGVPKGGVTTGESGAGGAGDEEPVRVPVALIVNDGALSPTTLTIPAFLALQFYVSSSGAATTLRLPGGTRLAVPADGKATKRLPGLKPGHYTVTTSAGGKATLHVVGGGDPGP